MDMSVSCDGRECLAENAKEQLSVAPNQVKLLL